MHLLATDLKVTSDDEKVHAFPSTISTCLLDRRVNGVEGAMTLRCFSKWGDISTELLTHPSTAKRMPPEFKAVSKFRQIAHLNTFFSLIA